MIRASDVLAVCPMDAAITAVRAGFVELSRGTVNAPVRSSGPLQNGGVLLTMPASGATSPAYSVKIASVVPGNPARGLPLVNATILLGDAITGEILAVIDGTSVTSLRTGAAGGVAAAALARPDSAIVALYGAGAQARMQLRAVGSVFRLREVRIVSQHREHAELLASEAREWPELAHATLRACDASSAVREADIVVTATNSTVPVFRGGALGEGVHITAVGSFKPSMRELDDDALMGARIIVDEREAALAEAGELRGLSASDVVEIGEVIAGTALGRRSYAERTIFKSVGNAVQDLVVSRLIYERACARGLGQEFELAQ